MGLFWGFPATNPWSGTFFLDAYFDPRGMDFCSAAALSLKWKFWISPSLWLTILQPVELRLLLKMCESRRGCPCSENHSGFQIRSSICLPERPRCTWWNVTPVVSCYPFVTQIRTNKIQNSSTSERDRAGERRKLSNVWNDTSMRSLPLSWQLKSKFYEDEEHGVAWADLTCCKGLIFWGLNWFGNDSFTGHQTQVVGGMAQKGEYP